MINHNTNEVFIDDLEVPAENLIGEEGMGFRYILDGMNAERILIAAECIGDGRWFIEHGRRHYASERVVFERPIGQNQGVQFPIARAYARIEAADLMRRQAASCTRRASRAAPRPTWPSCSPPRPPGRPPTSAWTPTAASASPREYDVERKFRETRLYQVAPVTKNLVLAYLAQNVLGLPRSY